MNFFFFFHLGTKLEFTSTPIRGTIEKRKAGNIFKIHHYSLGSFIEKDGQKVIYRLRNYCIFLQIKFKVIQHGS